MRELRLANVPFVLSGPEEALRRAWPLSRAALVLSLLAHVVGVYVASRWSWTGELPVSPTPTAEFVFMPVLPRAEPLVAPRPEAVEPAPLAPEEPEPEALESAPSDAVPPATAPRSAAPVPRAPTPAPDIAPETTPSSPLAPRITPLELEEARRRAASEVVEARAVESEFLTFSVDDVAPPRAEAAEPKRSIFDGTGSARVSGATVGQQRTRIGRRVAELCNALTGGFSFMGLGSFCAQAENEPSGLFPEVRPEILDLMPECEETRPLAAQLGEETAFPTVKCRLVPKPELPERWSLP